VPYRESQKKHRTLPGKGEEWTKQGTEEVRKKTKTFSKIRKSPTKKRRAEKAS